MESYVVYRLDFPDGKIYFGETKQVPENRWQNGLGYVNQSVGEAIKNFGWERVNREILHSDLTAQQAKEVEKYYITKYRTVSNGYNEIGELKDINAFSDDTLRIVYSSTIMTTETKLLTFEETRLKYIFFPEEEIFLQENDSGLVTFWMQEASSVKEAVEDRENYRFASSSYNIYWRVWQGNPTVREVMKTPWASWPHEIQLFVD